MCQMFAVCHRPDRAALVLVVVNLALQLFDGVATYVGLQAGFAEGNPLLAWALGWAGPAPALLVFKLEACACLLLVWHLRRSRLALPALAVSAAVYAVCSLTPWTVALSGL
jgi:hypothetical protein